MEYPTDNSLLRLPKKFKYNPSGSTKRLNPPIKSKRGRRAIIVRNLEPVGPRGGNFYINSKGKKVYISKTKKQ